MRWRSSELRPCGHRIRDGRGPSAATDCIRDQAVRVIAVDPIPDRQPEFGHGRLAQRRQLHPRHDDFWVAVDGQYDSESGEAETRAFDFVVIMELAPGPGSGPGAVDGPVPIAATPVVVPPPSTTIRSRKVRSRARSATFRFRSSAPDSTFRCRLDGRKATRCTSPKTYTRLSAGRHAFRVYTVDPAGRADPKPATARFTIPAQ